MSRLEHKRTPMSAEMYRRDRTEKKAGVQDTNIHTVNRLSGIYTAVFTSTQLMAVQSVHTYRESTHCTNSQSQISVINI